MSDEGKINGKYPTFNDILAFMWHKMKICPRDSLLNNIMKNFYKEADIAKARDTLFDMIPENGPRRVKHRKALDMLTSIYNVMQEIPTEDPPVFVAIDLNNIPCVDVKNIDAASLVCHQSIMQAQLDGVLNEQAAMKIQLDIILKHFESSSSSNAKAQPAPDPLACAAPLFSNVVISNDGTRDNSQSGGRPGHQSASAGEQVPRPENVRQSTSGVGHRRDPRNSTSRMSLREPNTVRDASNRNDDERVPRGFVRDNQGFLSRVPRPRQSSKIKTGKKTGTSLKVVRPVKTSRIFISRLDPECPIEAVQEFVTTMTGNDCVVEKLKPKFPSYSSFVITVNKEHEDTVLNPDEWEEGLILRPFYGKVNQAENAEST